MDEQPPPRHLFCQIESSTHQAMWSLQFLAAFHGHAHNAKTQYQQYHSYFNHQATKFYFPLTEILQNLWMINSSIFQAETYTSARRECCTP